MICKTKIIFIFVVLMPILCTSKDNRNALNSNESRLNGVGYKPFGGWANLCNMEEIWMDIPNYEGYYQISSIGRIKSLCRFLKIHNNLSRVQPEKILSPSVDGSGYLQIKLNKFGISKTVKIHRLVCLSFIGPSNLTVDHINSIKTDNRINNLEYVTRRENVARHYRKQNCTSKYTGVFWDKKLNKWRARIKINEKEHHLGCFLLEEDAKDAYQLALSKINS